MKIAIRSESDSRVLLYPLIRALYNYGTICVISNNVYLRRLLDVDSLEGGFRNVRVIVQPDGDLQAAEEEDEMFKDKYDYVIYDNMGQTDFDMEFIIITSRVSESYLQDIVWLIGEEGTKVFRFGAGVKPPKPEKSKSAKKPRKGKGKEEESVEEEQEQPQVVDDQVQVLDGKSGMAEESMFNEDGTIKNHWRREKTDAEILNEKLAEAQTVVLPFPSFEDIEKMECRWIFPKIDTKLAKYMYSILKDYISVDERSFTKGVQTNDEGGHFISGADVR